MFVAISGKKILLGPIWEMQHESIAVDTINGNLTQLS